MVVSFKTDEAELIRRRKMCHSSFVGSLRSRSLSSTASRYHSTVTSNAINFLIFCQILF